MDLVSLILEVQVITASGALSPGPLTVATAGLGVRNGWKSGFLVSLGHMIVEFPLTILLALGLVSCLSENLKRLLSLLGGLFLLYFSFLQFKSLKNVQLNVVERKENAIFTGVLLTSLNPYFILWWLTVGTKLILDFINVFSFYGIFVMYALHVWMDFAWLIFIAYAFYKGSRVNLSLLKLVLVGLGILMVYFGLSFIYNAVVMVS